MVRHVFYLGVPDKQYITMQAIGTGFLIGSPGFLVFGKQFIDGACHRFRVGLTNPALGEKTGFQQVRHCHLAGFQPKSDAHE
jgi:hypothetical protein